VSLNSDPATLAAPLGRDHFLLLPSALEPLRFRDSRSLLLLSGRPHMYIDPTTGSLVLQFLAAGVLSVLAMASRVREAVKSFFKMLLPRRRR
jgi:hypothetical protein